jgi:flagellar basal-body rod protein FlgB
MKLIDTSHSKLLAKAMDAYALRQKAIASNIANIDTPGYKRLDVDFEEELMKAQRLSSTQKELHEIDPKMSETEDPIQLEDEMFTLSDTQIRVQLVTRALRHSFSLLRTGITGRSQ